MTTINILISQIKMPFHLQFGVKLYIDKAYLKEYYMLNKLRDSWKHTAAAVAVAAGAALAAPGAAAEDTWFRTSDIREMTANDAQSAPYAASNGRIAVILYGDNDQVRGPVEYAAEYYATQEPAKTNVSYLWAKDNDGNPGTLRVGIYANGRHYSDLDIGINRAATQEGQEEIMNAVYGEIHGAYVKFLEKPKVATGPDQQPDS